MRSGERATISDIFLLLEPLTTGNPNSRIRVSFEQYFEFSSSVPLAISQ
uniref:C3 protein n=1 Tax=Banana bunchy top virus TaxID=12585 RepID=Q83027_BBTV|nr:C3 [Banana bunchy top virus]prf//2122372B ORF C3 [Banana bunchy top virus]